MGDIYFGTYDGKEVHKLGYISDIELASEESVDDVKRRFLDDRIEFSGCELQLKHKDGLDPWKYLASGGNRGVYNGLVLKEEGYLSSKNGWIGGQDEK